MTETTERKVYPGIGGFVEFIREQGVVGLAIGFILGGAVNTVVQSLVNSIINPLITLGFGSIKTLSAWSVGPVGVGAFLSALINLIIMAAVVYFIFKGLGLDHLDKPKK
ncbi:MAG TPA: MscL family protein [Candidatus Paceibacterota bacterium]|nr:MscL family protein [Candidatus Paceibacterota bacterium]